MFTSKNIIQEVRHSYSPMPLMVGLWQTLYRHDGNHDA